MDAIVPEPATACLFDIEDSNGGPLTSYLIAAGLA